jgi:hypothetical protein
MSSDLSVPRAAAATAAGAARPDRSAPDHGAARRDKTDPAEPAKPLPNPTLRLDPGLAIVVIEFRDETGAVRSTIPTEQQLDAYRTWERGHVGTPAPPGGGAAARHQGEQKAAPPPERHDASGHGTDAPHGQRRQHSGTAD